MPEPSGRLRVLAEATEALEDAPTIVALAAEALGSALPRCFVRAFASAAPTGAGCGIVAHAYGGGLVGGDHGAPSREVLPHVLRVAAAGQVWNEAVRQGHVAPSELGRLFEPLHPARRLRPKEWGLYLAAETRQLLAGAHVLVPDRAPEIGAADRALLSSLLKRLKAPLRLAALLGQAAPALAALDHLLASRPDPLILASESGALLAASPAGERLLARHPTLATAIRETLRRDRPRHAATLEIPWLDEGVTVTPCLRPGSAPAFLVQIADAPGGLERLSRRQAELLERLASGMSNKEIAAAMGLSPATVKSMLERLYRRARVPGRVGLVAWARKPAAPAGPSVPAARSLLGAPREGPRAVPGAGR